MTSFGVFVMAIPVVVMINKILFLAIVGQRALVFFVIVVSNHSSINKILLLVIVKSIKGQKVLSYYSSAAVLYNTYSFAFV